MNTSTTYGTRCFVAAVLLCTLIATILLSGCAPHRRGRVRAPRDVREEVHAARLRDWGAGPRLLRVGLAGPADSLIVETTGPTRFSGPGDAPVGATDAAGRRVFRRRTDGGLEWGRQGEPGALVIQAAAGGVVRIAPVDPRHVLRFDGRAYEGDLVIHQHADGLVLVNVVELDSYLRGVVPWEIGRPGEQGLAALEAQAVAARTYTVSHLGERHAYGCDVWGDVRDQVYKGLEGTDPWCDRAIANTAGLVLRRDGVEIEAYYSSTCGGRTSNVHEVWPRTQRPYLRSRKDEDRAGRAHCAASSHFTWEAVWSPAAFKELLNRTLPEYLDWLDASPARASWAGEAFRPAGEGADPRHPGAIRSIRVASRTSSGRVAKLEIETDAGRYTVRGDRTRWILPPPDGRYMILRSAWFEVSTQQDRDGGAARIVLSGRGFGHGVGMCQMGALGMAKAGHDVRDILDLYYPGARLETVR